jgi:hypothetical protein
MNGKAASLIFHTLSEEAADFNRDGMMERRGMSTGRSKKEEKKAIGAR